MITITACARSSRWRSASRSRAGPLRHHHPQRTRIPAAPRQPSRWCRSGSWPDGDGVSGLASRRSDTLRSWPPTVATPGRVAHIGRARGPSRATSRALTGGVRPPAHGGVACGEAGRRWEVVEYPARMLLAGAGHSAAAALGTRGIWPRLAPFARPSASSRHGGSRRMPGCTDRAIDLDVDVVTRTGARADLRHRLVLEQQLQLGVERECGASLDRPRRTTVRKAGQRERQSYGPGAGTSTTNRPAPRCTRCSWSPGS